MQGWVSETGGDGRLAGEGARVGKGRKTILKTQPGERGSSTGAPPVLQGPSLVGVCGGSHPSGYTGSHGDHCYISVGPKFSGISPNTSATLSHMTLLQIPRSQTFFSTLNVLLKLFSIILPIIFFKIFIFIFSHALCHSGS